MTRKGITDLRAVARNCGGFTLVELLVVMVLIGLFASFSLPRLADMGEMKLNRAANHVSHTITYLYAQSVANHIVIRLTFDLSNGEYYPATMNKEGKYEATRFPLFTKGRLGDGITVRKFYTLFGGRGDNNQVFLHLLPEGFAEQAVITLEDGAGREVSLVVNPISGQVRTEPGEISVDFSGQPA